MIVAGMHRSGTSALTRVINLLGGTIPVSTGAEPWCCVSRRWEPAEINRDHDLLLADAGRKWDDWRTLPAGYCEISEQTESVERIRRLLRDFNQRELLVIKDPRICRFIPLWKNLLTAEGFAPHVVIPLRRPAEVAASLTERNGFTTTKGLLLWLRYVLDAEHDSRGMSRTFVWYEDLLQNWEAEINRMALELNIRWPENLQHVSASISQFLQPELRHHRAGPLSSEANASCMAWVDNTYQALRSLSKGENEAQCQQQLDEVASALNDAQNHFEEFIPEVVAELDRQRGLAAALQRRVHILELRLAFQLNQAKKPNAQMVVDRQRLLASELFDADWYLRTYDDVRAAQADAATHYLERGAAEGRDASAGFSTLDYLQKHPGCAETGVNPVLHCLDNANGQPD